LDLKIGGDDMKTRLLLLGLVFISFGMLSFSQVNSDFVEPLNHHQFNYDYPAFDEYDIEFFDWMICPEAFDNDEHYQYLDLSWLDPNENHFYFNEVDETELLSSVEVFWDDGEEEAVVMEWMLNFEPHVIESLIVD